MRAKQYTQAWLQPLYGLTVHSNGMREAPGTRLRIERARTSWKVIPRNSGVSKVRVTTEAALKSAPDASGAPGPPVRLSQRMSASLGVSPRE